MTTTNNHASTASLDHPLLESSPAKKEEIPVDVTPNAAVAVALAQSSPTNITTTSTGPTQNQKMTPYSTASFLSLITYHWINGLMLLGYKRALQIEDIYQLSKDYQSDYQHVQFTKKWNEEKARGSLPSADPSKPTRPPSLISALSHTYGKVFYPAGLLKFIGDVSQIVTPEVLRLFIAALQSYQTDPNSVSTSDIYLLATALFALQCLATFSVNYYFQVVMLIGFQVRTALTTALYDKTLKLSSRARQQLSSGQAVNLISTDTSRLDTMAGYLHYVWSGPVQIIIITALLIQLLGASALVGFGILLIFMPVQGLIMKRLGSLRMAASKLTDQRVKMTSEVLQGIRVIKFYAWEQPFMQQLSHLRQQEMQRTQSLSYLRAVIAVIMNTVPIVSSMLTFVVYVAIGNNLDASLIFPALAYFNLLRLPLMMLPNVMAQVADAKVAAKRIEKFLLAEELSFRPKVDEHAPFAVTVVNGEFIWDEPEVEKKEADKKKGKETMSKNTSPTKDTEMKENPTAQPFGLKNIQLAIPRGQLTVIVGKVGSGKSSLLSALVGEMALHSGEIIFSGRVGYCPQQPWIQNASLKDNILFGTPFDAKRYAAAIHYAALEKDITTLPDGDQTEIGEKGINLSGGQKARVNLARLIYNDPDICLLDDPLSAVDAHVGRFLMTSCIQKHLKQKTRLLVTHQLHVVPQCDYVIVMDQGKILEHGTYNTLMSQPGGVLSDLMHSYSGTDKDDEQVEDATAATDNVQEASPSSPALGKRSVGKQSKVEEVPPNKPMALMTQEERATGAVKAGYYWTYMAACGGIIFLVPVLITLVISRGTQAAGDAFLAYISQGDSSMIYYLLLFGVAQALGMFLYSIVFVLGGIRASLMLHDRALKSVLGAPLSFFDTTPLGRILNRFSKDQDAIDSLLPSSLNTFLSLLANALATFALIVYVTPVFLAALVPLLVLYYFVQLFYRSTSRELKRLDALMKSPLFAQFSETWSGLSTLRAYREEQRCFDRHCSLVDTQNRPVFHQLIIQRWLGLRLESVGNFLVLAAALSAVAFASNAALAGVSVTYALSVTGMLNWCVRQAAETEIYMNAVERMDYYAHALPVEGEIKNDNNTSDNSNNNNNDKNAIVFDQVSLRYRPELPLVLQQVSFSIPARSKIGVVGRTASGKSSLMAALFRLVECDSGRILLSGQETRKMTLVQLRNELAIIPQDPVLFSGTVRSNLDPFGKYEDVHLWEVLERAFLKEAITALALKLDAPVAEGGENFSLGQRQLLCLARAMLRDASILVLDEATASIDMATDSLLQAALRRDFQKCTILTIAHRLQTIMDYDKIIVMDHGKIVEFDAPWELVKREGGVFRALVEETGPQNAQVLVEVAEKARVKMMMNQTSDAVLQVE